MHRIAGVLLLLVFLAIRPAAAQPLPTDDRLTTGECANGLRYVVVRHHMPPFRAQIWLQVDAGSLHETEQQRGAAHLISHLAFSGSENYPPDAVGPLLESLGMRAGADLNSQTTLTESVYKMSLRESNAESVRKALGFLREIAGRLTFPGADVEKERTAVLAEQKASVNLEQRMQEFLLDQLAPGTVIGKRLRLGTPDSVAALSADDLRAFYRRWYVPSNMTLVFVGDLDAAEVVRHVESTIGAGPRSPRPELPGLGVPTYESSRAAVVSDAELTGARAYVLRPTPMLGAIRTVDDLRRRVLDSLAIAAFNRRLGTKVDTGKFPYAETGAFSTDFSGVCQLTGLYVGGAPGEWKDALRAVAEELQRARLHGLYASEIDESKAQFLAQADTNAKNEAMRQGAAYAAALIAGASRGDALMSATQTAEQLRSIMESLDEKTVSEHFARLTDPSAVLFMLAIPSTVEVPSEADVLAAGVEAVKAAPAAETEFVMPTELMTERPAPGKVVEEQEHQASGVWSAWLDNGVRVHVRPMDVNKGLATITVAIAGGVIEETDLTRGLTEAGSVAWSRPATSRLPSFVIQNLTEWKEIRVGGGPGIDNLLLAVTGPVDELEMGMQLLHVLLTDPVIEAPGLDQWKRAQAEAAAARTTQPREVFNDAMLDLIYPPGETRPRSLTPAQVERVTLEAAQGWFRHQLSDGPIEVSVVGDITRERAIELVTIYVGSLPARERISSATLDSLRNIAHPEGPRNAIREVKGVTETAFIMAGFLGTDAQNVADARLLGVAAQVLNARLTSVLQEAGLVQNVLVQSQPAQEFPGFGMFGVFAPTEPANAQPAITRIFEVFDEFRAAGPSMEELSEAKRRVALELEEAMANPNFWSGQLSLLEYRGITLDELAGALEPYRVMTPEDVKSAFAKYDGPGKRMQLILEQKAEAAKVLPVEQPQGAPR